MGTLKLSEISNDPVAFAIAQKEIKRQLLKKPRGIFAHAIICPWIIIPIDLKGTPLNPEYGPEHCLKLRQKYRPHWVKTGRRPYFVNVSPKRWICLNSEKYTLKRFGNVIPDKRYKHRDDWLSCPIFNPSQTTTIHYPKGTKERIGVLTSELKAQAGLDVKYIPEFSTGTAGLRKVKTSELKNKK